ncbi:asparagine synthase (glutamine-hydrolysing) [Mariprofundus micogutta]|uniref:asparagine synthase (glutamine-hydrolyzing) n=1 Tax=Mariprofundus micogutta TaxID=1921010 RepID=A0A1L8CM12_9PROT|nr:asparagine synthase (glutamine-hydrolyzing) [Mariprofundus micogutta]GAV19889.1 asparagine synthase (glutamine-hydrolysing) [Mariprofundus micogutta]
MCGFIAAVTDGVFSQESADRALDRLAVRGPDGVGEWKEDGIYLGHRRLAILDLDHRAEQPMHSICNRYVIVFNGEIYNYKVLRSEMETQGKIFRTTSDTEVILALFAAEGEAMLERLHGMFSFVIWDRTTRKVFAARDPYGIKPLYIATIANGVLLGSQVKALVATGMVSKEPDEYGQAGFWMLGSVPEPHTWYRDIQAVQAGHCLWIEDSKVISFRKWYDIGEAWHTEPTIQALSNEEVGVQIRDALRESVERHLVADVPVGVFLSGGIDSGALAGLMVEAGTRDLEGITIAYDEFAGSHEDEAPVASRIAHHYGISHHIRRITQEEFLEDLPKILDAMDQPSIDGVNTWYASKAVAERGLKVVVSGVGGDELFFGYDSFRRLPLLVRIWEGLSQLPGAMSLARTVAQVQAKRTGNGRWRYAPEWAQTMAGAWWLRRSLNGPDVFSELMDSELAAKELQDFNVERQVESMTGSLGADRMMALAQIESMTYMRNQLLRDSDWASMSHSVELRTPLVDSFLLQQLQPLIPEFKRFPNKMLLANAPKNPLPQEIVERRKTGFAIPVKRWFREGVLNSQCTEEAKGERLDWLKYIDQTYDEAKL